LLAGKRSRLEQTAERDRPHDQQDKHESGRDRDPSEISPEVGDPIERNGRFLRRQGTGRLPPASRSGQRPLHWKAAWGRLRRLDRLIGLAGLAWLGTGHRWKASGPGGATCS